MQLHKYLAGLLTIALSITALGQRPRMTDIDVLIKGGLVYDGTGTAPRRVDVAIKGDRIVAIGNLKSASARNVVDAQGLAVAPGFINMLSWSTESLIVDGRSQGEIRQGVTTQIMGEGWSMGPLNDRMKQQVVAEQDDIKFDVEWTTLAEYLKYLEKRGVSQNVASYVGATTVRQYVLGESDVQPTPAQLQEMRELVRQAMEEGALGVGSSLIYAPAFYARTEELIELCKVAARYKGKYISHLRSEGNEWVQAVEELIRISREAGLPAEIYHIKAAGQQNWDKVDRVLALVNAARRTGLKITADMYMYPAGATGLNASLPPWALDGGYEALFKRLEDPATRQKIAAEVRTPSDKWENLYLAAGSPDRVAAGWFQVGEAETTNRQNAGRGRTDAGERSGRDDHGLDT